MAKLKIKKIVAKIAAPVKKATAKIAAPVKKATEFVVGGEKARKDIAKVVNKVRDVGLGAAAGGLLGGPVGAIAGGGAATLFGESFRKAQPAQPDFLAEELPGGGGGLFPSPEQVSDQAQSLFETQEEPLFTEVGGKQQEDIEAARKRSLEEQLAGLADIMGRRRELLRPEFERTLKRGAEALGSRGLGTSGFEGSGAVQELARKGAEELERQTSLALLPEELGVRRGFSELGLEAALSPAEFRRAGLQRLLGLFDTLREEELAKSLGLLGAQSQVEAARLGGKSAKEAALIGAGSNLISSLPRFLPFGEISGERGSPGGRSPLELETNRMQAAVEPRRMRTPLGDGSDLGELGNQLGLRNLGDAGSGLGIRDLGDAGSLFDPDSLASKRRKELKLARRREGMMETPERRLTAQRGTSNLFPELF